MSEKKKRNTTKPAGTLSPDDVVLFHLRMWELRDAIVSGDLTKIDAAAGSLWECIPNTTTNTGARQRARNIRRQQEEAGKATPYEVGTRAGDGQSKTAADKAAAEAFAALSPDEQRRVLDKLERIVEQFGPQDAGGQATAETPEQPANQPADPEPKLDENEFGRRFSNGSVRLPTEKMRKAIVAFNDMSDTEQVSRLKEMWGDA